MAMILPSDGCVELGLRLRLVVTKLAYGAHTRHETTIQWYEKLPIIEYT